MRRLAGWLAALVIAWPMLALSEFKPWALFGSGNLAVIGGFLAGFFPPAGSPDFLALLAKATLETLAMATAGTALALLIGAPLAFVTTRALSISRIGPGPGRVQAGIVRQAARWLLMVLRAIPEIVWALLFVRALGLGPAAGVLALAITYGGMLGKVYAEILESTDTRPHARCSKAAAAGWRRCATASCRTPRRSWPRTPCTAGNARCVPRW
jgi:phosphonate transport system permease protein